MASSATTQPPSPATDQPDPAALAHCPFCGGAAYFERFGTPRASCVVACEDCGASLETNETPPFCGSAWNRRVSPPAPPTTPAAPDPRPSPDPRPLR